MNCGKIRPLLSALVDGEATQEESGLVQRHLASCADCAAVLSEYREIGANIRHLSRPVPPSNLRNKVLSQLKTRRQRGLVFGRSAASLVGLVGVAVVIIILVVGLTTVYRRAAGPQDLSVTASRPVDRSNAVPVDVAISLEFNRPMDSLSVDGALKANPSFPYEETWQGNSLKITPRVTLQPDTDYTLTIDGSAKDQSGVPLKKSFSISFHTQKLEATATIAATEPAVIPGQPMEVPPPTSEPTATATITPVTPTATGGSAVPTGKPSPESTSAETPSATITPVPSGTPSAIPTSPPSEGTSTPVGTPGTPTQVPTSGSPSGTPTLPAPGSTPAATLPPLQNYTITPVRGFGLVYFGHSEVSQALGAAVEYEKNVNASEQLFERGSMYWREDTEQVYVIFDDATQRVFGYSLNGAASNGPTGTPPPGFSEPTGVFGKLWHEQPGLRDKLGWAAQTQRSFVGVAQPFEHGAMLWSDRKVIYVVYDSGASARFPDLYQP